MDVILLYGKCKWSDIKDYFESDTDNIKDGKHYIIQFKYSHLIIL